MAIKRLRCKYMKYLFMRYEKLEDTFSCEQVDIT